MDVSLQRNFDVEDFAKSRVDAEIEETPAPGGAVEWLLRPSVDDEAVNLERSIKRKSKNEAFRVSVIAELEAENATNRAEVGQKMLAEFWALVEFRRYIHILISISRLTKEDQRETQNGSPSGEIDMDDQEACSSGDEKVELSKISNFAEQNDLLSEVRVLSDEQIFFKNLRGHRKHVFIMSEAGKPIYSRYCDDSSLTPLVGLMHALVSFVEAPPSDNNELQYLSTGQWNFWFLHQPPLIFVAASKNGLSLAQLYQLLNLVYNHILSLLTQTRLLKIFEQHNNYDLRRLLTNTDKEFENLIEGSETDAAYALNAVKCLNMPGSVRDTLNQTIANCIGKNNHVVFAILLVKNQLVSMSRMKKYTLHPLDLELLINLVSSNDSFKTAELWIPICLPRLDNSGFLHAYISRLTEICDACLILLTVDRSKFFVLSELKSCIVDKLTRSKAMQPFVEACNANRSIRLSEMQIADMWHFLYKNRTSSQFIYPDFEVPYNTEELRKHVSQMYLKLHNFMHSDDSQTAKIVFINGDKESLLGWITVTFELYAVFSPLTLKSVAIGNVEKLMKWLKKEEDHLFILNPVLL